MPVLHYCNQSHESENVAIIIFFIVNLYNNICFTQVPYVGGDSVLIHGYHLF